MKYIVLGIFLALTVATHARADVYRPGNDQPCTPFLVDGAVQFCMSGTCDGGGSCEPVDLNKNGTADCCQCPKTINRNYILDTRFPPMDDPAALDASVRAVPGVVDTGLFLGMADVVLVGTPDGLDRLER